MKEGTQSWCTGTTQKDGKGREVGGANGEGAWGQGDTCTLPVMSMYGKNHYNIVNFPIIIKLSKRDTDV